MLDKILVPLVTPFTDDTTTLSEIRVARLVRYHREQGASGFVVAAEAGEVPMISLAERKQLLEWVIQNAHGDPVFVNATANSTSAAVDLAQHAERHGAKGAIIHIPTHTALTPDEQASFAATIHRFANLPVAILGSTSCVKNQPNFLTLSTLSQAGLGPISIYKEMTFEEFVWDGHVATPLAIFGSDLARTLVQNWATLQIDVRNLLAHGRTHRVGKAAMPTFGVELGPPRSPIHELDQADSQLLDKILQSLGVIQSEQSA